MCMYGSGDTSKLRRYVESVTNESAIIIIYCIRCICMYCLCLFVALFCPFWRVCSFNKYQNTLYMI